MTLSTPAPDPKTLDKLLQKGLSTKSRFGHVALLIAAIAMSLVLLSLLMTEPDLRTRTQVTFAVMLMISLGWASYAAWTLKYRWTLLAQHRIAASFIGITASLAFTLGAALIAIITREAAAGAAATSGLFMVALAGLALKSALERRRALSRRRDELEALLALDLADSR